MTFSNKNYSSWRCCCRRQCQTFLLSIIQMYPRGFIAGRRFVWEPALATFWQLALMWGSNIPYGHHVMQVVCWCVKILQNRKSVTQVLSKVACQHKLLTGTLGCFYIKVEVSYPMVELSSLFFLLFLYITFVWPMSLFHSFCGQPYLSLLLLVEHWLSLSLQLINSH